MIRVSRMRRSGFTLMELLVTSLIVVVLLSALWSLLGMQLRLFESGRSQTEEAHLVRALLTQMERDIQSVIHVKQDRRRSASRHLTAFAAEEQQDESSPSANESLDTAEDPLAQIQAEPESEQDLPEENPALADDSSLAFDALKTDDSPYGVDMPDAINKLRVSGLVGSSSSLRLDVLRAADPFSIVHPEQEDDDLLPPNPLLQLKELRTVTYQFIAPPARLTEELSTTSQDLEQVEFVDEVEGIDSIVADSEDNLALAPPLQGLVRRETPWQFRAQSYGQRSQTGELSDQTTASIATENSAETSTSLMSDPRTTSTDVNSIESIQDEDVASEVSLLRFRYYDGSSWRSQWNSISDGRLPVAIEISLNIGEDSESELTGELGSSVDVTEDPLAQQFGPDSTFDSPSATLLDESLGMTAEPELTDYRLVIFLPRSEPRSVEPTTFADESMFSAEP